MRRKKNREVNIFSASVVDLFASGLGVFLIVSIIALVNQKKENSKASDGDASHPMVAQMQGEIESLSAKLKKTSNENFELKSKNLKSNNTVSKSENSIEQKLELESLRSNLAIKEQELNNKNQQLQIKLNESKNLIAELEKSVSEMKNNAMKGIDGVGTNFNDFEVGSKIRLENVHFYPGTDRAIEPYASREIVSFAKYMKENPAVMVEVSGHIFETKKAIESGKADDIYNLSGKRARHVCEKLVDFGVKAKRLNCVGYGAQRAVFLTNDQFSEKAQQNRRVEVEILSK